MKLDSGKVWSDATAMVAANKEVLIVLAGVFFLLPSLAFSLFVPQPQPPEGAELDALMGMLSEYYIAAAPWFALITLVQAVGQLATMVLLARAGKATVGEAIREAFGGLLPFIGVQLIYGVVGIVIGAIVLTVSKLTGSVALTVILMLALFVAAIWLIGRLTLVLPVIGIDGQRNPITAISRSWELTKGNAGRILVFLLLLLIAAMVVGFIVGAVIGILMALIGGEQAALIGSAVVSSLLSAVVSLYVAASIAAMHRQLAGEWESNISETFA